MDRHDEQPHDGGSKFPHHVDLVPPIAGFDEDVEEEMIAFLEQRVGTFDLYGEIESGDAFVRYCFARHGGRAGVPQPVRGGGRQGTSSRGQLSATARSPALRARRDGGSSRQD